jgi:hypothetical protein
MISKPTIPVATLANLRGVMPWWLWVICDRCHRAPKALPASGGIAQRRFEASARPAESGGINRTGACMPRGRQSILRMAACCALLVVTMATRSTFATAGDRAQQGHQDLSITVCSTLIQRNSPHLETVRPACESVQVSPQAIRQATTVPAEARFTTDSSVGAFPTADGRAYAFLCGSHRTPYG